MAYQPLHHKYRPQTFGDLVGQEAIATTLMNALQQQRIAPAYLFTGARGTGKTSSARILAKSLNCIQSTVPTAKPCGNCDVCHAIAKGSALDVIEIDAASNTGVDNIRELIERSQFAPVQCRYKVYVIDECHMLSTAAFNALLKTLEEPPDRVVFVLATTDPQRVLPTIISRCQRFDFRRIPLEPMVQHLQKIAHQEDIAIHPDAITLIGQIAQGGLRDAESLLDQLSLLTGEVTIDHVWDLVGSVPERDLMALLEAIAQDNPEMMLDNVRRLMDRGREPLIVLQNLASFYRDLLIAKTAPDRNDLVALTPPTWAALCQFAQRLDVATILAGQQQLRSSEDQIKSTTQPRLWLEVTLMGLLPSAVSRQPVAAQASSSSPAPERRSPRTVDGGEPTRMSPASVAVVETPPPAIPPSVGDTPMAAIATSPSPADSRDITRTSDVAHADAPTPPAGISTDLSQTWQQILSNVDLAGTRAMLSVNCHLISISDQEIVVGIKSQKMLKMISGMSPQLEKAYTKAFKLKVKVNLQVVEGAAPTPPPANATVAEYSSAETAAPQLPQTFAPNTPKTSEPAAAQWAGDPPMGRHSQPEGARSPSPSHPPSQINNATTHSHEDVAPASIDPWQQDDEVTRAAKQLAEFFGGRVVDMTDRDPASVPPGLNEISTASLQEKSATALQDTDADTDRDDDVPF